MQLIVVDNSSAASGLALDNVARCRFLKLLSVDAVAQRYLWLKR